MPGLSGSAPTPTSRRRGSTTRSCAAVVEHHLRRLGTDDLAALVVDLWAGRGFETSHEGRLVVATRGRETVTIAVVGRRRLGTPSLPDRPTDVVVAPGTTAVDPAAGNPRILDASDLREMLFYAVDRPTSRQLCGRHLGEQPGQLRPPLATRLRNRSRTAASRVTPAVALALIVVVGLGAVAGLAFTPTAEQHDPSATTRADADAAVAPGEANRSTVAPPYAVLATESAGAAEPADSETVGFVGTLRSPPGVTQEGITNLTALAAAHERVVTSQSYTLRLEPTRPINPLWERDRRTIRIAVAGDRYLLAETRELPEELLSIREMYYNGSTLQVAEFDENGTIESVRQMQVGESSADRPGPNPFELQETLLTRYLSTPETTVTDRISERNRTMTRIVARGTPDGIEAERVQNYKAVALVDDRGFLRNLTVEYTPTTRPLNYTIRFEARHGNLDETTVRSPWWHGQPLPRFRGPARVDGVGLPGVDPSR